jgi:hypothetical protein
MLILELLKLGTDMCGFGHPQQSFTAAGNDAATEHAGGYHKIFAYFVPLKCRGMGHHDSSLHE